MRFTTADGCHTATVGESAAKRFRGRGGASDVCITFDVVDESEVCFHVPDPLDSAERLGVIHVRDEAVAQRLTDVFDRIWEEAVPLSTVLEGRGVEQVTDPQD